MYLKNTWITEKGSNDFYFDVGFQVKLSRCSCNKTTKERCSEFTFIYRIWQISTQVQTVSPFILNVKVTERKILNDVKATEQNR